MRNVCSLILSQKLKLTADYTDETDLKQNLKHGKLMVTLPLGFETRSLPTLIRSYPRRFAFYVAPPTRSIHQSRVAGLRSR